MFGMKQDREAKDAFSRKKPAYDLEVELNGPSAKEKEQELKKLIQERVESLKTLLRKGEDREEFEQSETLLHGYLSLQKVVDKIKKK